MAPPRKSWITRTCATSIWPSDFGPFDGWRSGRKTRFLFSELALRHPAGEGVPLTQLEYTRPDTYEAFWDGRDSSGRQVASGVYFCQVTVNGRSKVMRMFVTK